MARLQVDRVEDQRLELRLSSQALLTLNLSGPPTLEVKPVAAATHGKGWLVREVGPAERDGSGRWQQQFRLEPLEPGELLLQLEPLFWRADARAERWEKTTWAPLTVHVLTEISEAKLGSLREIPCPEELPAPASGTVWLWWALGAGLAGLAVASIVWSKRRRLRTRMPSLSPEDGFLQDLAVLEAESCSDATAADRLHTQLSQAVRRYFESRLQLPATSRTTAEFMESLDRASALTVEQRESLRELLRQCDLVKFARVTPTSSEWKDLTHRARVFAETRQAGA